MNCHTIYCLAEYIILTLCSYNRYKEQIYYIELK